MNKNELLVISICIFLTILAWMFADLVHAKKSTVVNDVASQVTIPSYTINAELLTILKDKTP